MDERIFDLAKISSSLMRVFMPIQIATKELSVLKGNKRFDPTLRKKKTLTPFSFRSRSHILKRFQETNAYNFSLSATERDKQRISFDKICCSWDICTMFSV